MDPVHLHPVRVKVRRQGGAGVAGQLGEAAHSGEVARRAFPDRERGPPVPISREGPILGLIEEIAEPAVLHVAGDPEYLVVVPYQCLPELGTSHEPGIEGPVEEGRRAPPACGIGVTQFLFAEERSRGAQVVQEQRVGGLEALPGDRRHLVGEDAMAVERVEEPDVLPLTDPLVVHAVARRDVDESGALGFPHEFVQNDSVAALPGTGEGKQRRVGKVRELGADVAMEDFRSPGEKPRDRSLGEHVLVAIRASDTEVREIRPRGDEEVGGQRPGRGRPGEEVPRRSVVGRRHVEADGHRRVGEFLVALGDFVGRERGLAARAVREGVESFRNEPAVEQCLERPPDALDVVRVHRGIGMVVVEPVPDLAAHFAPGLHVLVDAGAALLTEPVDAVGLDLALELETVPFLDLELDRESVAVPPAHRRDDPVASHPAVAQRDVLQRPGQRRPEVGSAVGRRRTLGEAERRAVRMEGQGPGNEVGVCPEFLHASLGLQQPMPRWRSGGVGRHARRRERAGE